MVCQDDFLHWIGAELGPLGLDVALPAGRGREASICRDVPDLARVSMQEVKAARSRRTQKAGGSVISREIGLWVKGKEDEKPSKKHCETGGNGGEIWSKSKRMGRF